jgi:hypothetical protein
VCVAVVMLVALKARMGKFGPFMPTFGPGRNKA